MKVLRFLVPGLCALGVAACVHAAARLVGWVPVGKLALYPLWAGVHFATATAFAVLAPLQLWPRLRARRPALHRLVGRITAAMGAVMAVSGIAIVYDAPDRTVGELIFMTVFFAAYLVFLGLGVRAAVGRNIAAHQAWMVRMTATALTPVTQRLLLPPLISVIGIDGMDTFWQLFVSAAWVGWGLNMVVAEAWLQARSTRRAVHREPAPAA
jgi:uncharacterized membrane protein